MRGDMIKFTLTAIARLHRSSLIPQHLVDVHRMSVCLVHSTHLHHINLANSRCTASCSSSSSTGRYLQGSSFVGGGSRKFFHAFHHFKTSCNQMQTLQGQHNHICADKHFHTSSLIYSHPQIVQDDKCRCLEIRLETLTLKIPFVWLRDHCRSEKYYNHKTCQKNVDLDLMKQDLTPATVVLTDNKLGIVVTWKDGHITEFTCEFLINNFYPGHFNDRRTQRLLWDNTIIKSESLPTVSHNDHMTTESGLKQTLRNLVKYGFTFVEETPASLEGTQAVVERISVVSETIFGRMWSFTANAARGDTAYSTQRLGAHTDNTYLSTPAGIQVFQCLEHTGTGGETLLVDGFNAIDILRTLDQTAFQILRETVVPHEYKESATGTSPGYHLYSLSSVISTHPASGRSYTLGTTPTIGLH